MLKSRGMGLAISGIYLVMKNISVVMEKKNGRTNSRSWIYIYFDVLTISIHYYTYYILKTHGLCDFFFIVPTQARLQKRYTNACFSFGWQYSTQDFEHFNGTIINRAYKNIYGRSVSGDNMENSSVYNDHDSMTTTRDRSGEAGCVYAGLQ